ncbi:MAG: outer membrane beta-barrel family protein, partial [Muribaculaceae bacterium]|nr:outer membrane beta-barrel family protein [Muribaculaceae bacterium]
DIGNSYRSLELKRAHDVSFFLFKNIGKCELQLSLPVGFVGQTLDYRRGVKPFRIERNSVAIDDSRLFLQYQSDGAINGFEYNVATSLPSLTSMVTITDDTDPLNFYEGNPDLRNAYRHQFTYRLNTAGFKHNLTLNGSFTTDQIVNGYMYDNSTGIRRYKTFNINGDWDAAINYSKGEMNFGLGKGFFMGITTATEVKFHNAVDMIGDAGDSPRKSDVRNFTVNENLKINWFCPSPRSLLSLLVNATWRNSTSPDHRGFRPINAAEFNYGLNYVVNLPANFHISTDFGAYTRIGYGSKELDKTDLVWNARVSCTLGKGKWLIALDGFDLLNQLRNVSYSVNPQGRIEVRTNTLPRYALLHVQYRLNLLPKKRK